MRQRDDQSPPVAQGLTVMGSPTRPGKEEAPMMPSSAPSAAADEPEHRCLDQELPSNEPGCRTERLAQSDFTDPFGDRDQHDVHDPDAADQERYAGHPAEKDGQGPIDRGRGRQHRLFRGDRGVGVGRPTMMWWTASNSLSDSW